MLKGAFYNGFAGFVPHGFRAAPSANLPRPWKGRGDIRRAAVRGLGTFTWGFLRHSPASVLARGKNRGDARRVSVEKTRRESVKKPVWKSVWKSV